MEFGVSPSPSGHYLKVGSYYNQIPLQFPCPYRVPEMEIVPQKSTFEGKKAFDSVLKSFTRSPAGLFIKSYPDGSRFPEIDELLSDFFLLFSPRFSYLFSCYLLLIRSLFG